MIYFYIYSALTFCYQNPMHTKFTIVLLINFNHLVMSLTMIIITCFAREITIVTEFNFVWFTIYSTNVSFVDFFFKHRSQDFLTVYMHANLLFFKFLIDNVDNKTYFLLFSHFLIVLNLDNVLIIFSKYIILKTFC